MAIMNKRKVKYFKDADDYQANCFGKPINMRSLIGGEKEFAHIFAEGSEALESLLLELWEKGYSTKGCCKGHEVPEAYIKIGMRKIKHMTAEEYHQRQQKRFFKGIRGFQRIPEFALPYLELNHLTEREEQQLKTFLKGQMQNFAGRSIKGELGCVSISFQNQYDRQIDHINNEECWKEIRETFQRYFEKYPAKRNWRRNIEINESELTEEKLSEIQKQEEEKKEARDR